MCGICGVVSPDPAHFAHTGEQLAAILHRGPDEGGAWRDGPVFLGSRRLSIIDLAGGHQPMFTDDRRCCLVYNGELYNFHDLRAELVARGYRFDTRSDTEVVLRSYEAWGIDCVERFNGMFAFALWDERHQRLMIARDRLGEKPLYYFWDGTRLVFASEIKAILADPTIPREVDPQGLRNYLTFGHGVAPRTIYRRIAKLLPAHYLCLQGGRIAVRQYWDVGDEPILEPGREYTEAQYAGMIRALLDDSVRRRMLADVPVGAFLSGGVDSSAIVALMQRHATGPVKTFSLGFAIGGAYDELADARGVAKALGTEHHELTVAHGALTDALRTLVYHYDAPFGDPAAFPTYLLSRFARERVKVVLTGEGGDELFGGYRRYAIDQFAPLYQRLPGWATERAAPALIGALPRLRRLKLIGQALPIAAPADRYARWLTVFDAELLGQVASPEALATLDAGDPVGAYRSHYARLNGATAADHLNRLMYIDLKTWLADTYLEKVDKATMACSLEGRVPLLDHRLVELAFQIPSRFKIRGLATKRVFKRAVRELVPPDVLRRPKHGFAVPTDPWFRGDLKEFTFEVLLDRRATGRGYFNPVAIERLWREHQSGRHAWDSQLWLLLNLELWHRVYLDREGL